MEPGLKEGWPWGQACGLGEKTRNSELRSVGDWVLSQLLSRPGNVGCILQKSKGGKDVLCPAHAEQLLKAGRGRARLKGKVWQVAGVGEVVTAWREAREQD